MSKYYVFASVFSTFEGTRYTQDPLDRTSALCEVKTWGLLSKAVKCFVDSKGYCDFYDKNCNWNRDHTVHLYYLDEQGKAVHF